MGIVHVPVLEQQVVLPSGVMVNGDAVMVTDDCRFFDEGTGICGGVTGVRVTSVYVNVVTLIVDVVETVISLDDDLGSGLYP